jgi:hypothetical protein
MPKKTEVRFVDGYTRIDNGVFEDPDMGARDIAILAAIAYHASGGCNDAWPSIDRLSKLTNTSRPTVIAALKQLEGRYITTEKREGKSSIYWVGRVKNVASSPVDQSNGFTGTSKMVLPEQEPVEQEKKNGHFTFPSGRFTDLWRTHAGASYTITGPEYALAKKDYSEVGEEDVARAVARAFQRKDFPFSKRETVITYKLVHSQLPTLLNGHQSNGHAPRDACPNCQSRAMQYLAGNKAQCTSCNTVYERQTA